MTKSILFAATALVLGAFAQPAFANEQPHTAPVMKLYSGGHTVGADLGSEQGGSFNRATARPVFGAGYSGPDVGSETTRGFDASRSITVGVMGEVPTRMVAIRATRG